MRLARLSDISLIYSSVAGSTYAEWSSSTTYATGDTVKVTLASDGVTERTPHEEYESLADSNTGNYPPDNPDKWQLLGATNRWKMFDDYVNTQTEDTTDIVVEIDSSNTNIVGLFNLQGETVRLTNIVNTELFTDGDMSSDSFTKGTGWTYDSTDEEYDCDGSQTEDSQLYQDISVTEDSKYIIKFTVKNYSSGSIRPVVGGAEGTAVSADGSYTEIITAGASTVCGLMADSDFVGSVDDLSLMRVSNDETTEIQLDESYTPDYWYYFFADFTYREDLVWSYSLYHNAKLRIEISPQSGEAKCGMVAIGKAVELGSTMYDISTGIIDYSQKSTDSLGRTYLAQGNYAKRVSLTGWLRNENLDIVMQALADVRGTPIIFDANNDDCDYQALIVYGFIKDFEIIIPGPNVSKLEITVEGLT